MQVVFYFIGTLNICKKRGTLSVCPRGLPGPPGRAGPKGDKGDQGRRGREGSQGMMGYPGRSEKQGIMDLPGIRGEKGIKGDTGAPGIPGMKGEPGESFSAPKVTVSNSRLTVNESTTVSLLCSASGNPAPQITWSRENGVLSSNRTKVTTEGLMQIDDARLEDVGKYKCVGQNILGRKEEVASLVVQSKHLFKQCNSLVTSGNVCFIVKKRKFLCSSTIIASAFRLLQHIWHNY